MFGVVLIVTFITPVIYPLFIAAVVVSYLWVYVSCWVPVYAYSWINIYRGWTNNGNTRQDRNKTVCVGCTDRTLVVSFVILLFVLYSASVSALQIVLVTVCMKVLQNGRLITFSKRTDCWCTFSWSICNQNSHFIRCIHSSSFQGYDDIQIMAGHRQLRGIVVKNHN